MNNRILAISLFATIVGVTSFALAQTSTGAVSTTSSPGVTSAQSGASASAQTGGRLSVGGSFTGGMVVSNGMINGQKVFVVNFTSKSTNASGTDETQKVIKEQDVFSMKMANEGKLIIAGQYMDDGSRTMTILSKNSNDAAKMAWESPMGISGLYLVKVRELRVVAAGTGGTQSPAGGALTPTQDTVEPGTPIHP